MESEEDFSKKLKRFRTQAAGVFDEFDKGGSEEVSATFKTSLLEQMTPESKEVRSLMITNYL